VRVGNRRDQYSGLVGPDGLAERLGRNQRFASVGGLTAAGVIGLASYVLSARATLVVRSIPLGVLNSSKIWKTPSWSPLSTKRFRQTVALGVPAAVETMFFGRLSGF
jgi:hypothetical protein